MIFLGRIVQELSGDDYEVYITKNILMPLGGMSLRLLKFSGGSVDDYAICRSS